MRTLGDEPAVEIHKAKEFSKFGERRREGKITDGVDFRVKGLATVCSNFVSKELER